MPQSNASADPTTANGVALLDRYHRAGASSALALRRLIAAFGATPEIQRAGIHRALRMIGRECPDAAELLATQVMASVADFNQVLAEMESYVTPMGKG